jgi:hypothetical protein
MKKVKSTGKPYFSQFLERQEKQEQEKLTRDEKKSLKGGGGKGGYKTMKYPSDGDDDIYI